MSSLIKYDFLRVIKDKLFLATVIVCLSIAIVFPIFFFVIDCITKAVDGGSSGFYISTPVNLVTYFSPAGFIILLFLSIIVHKDCGQGTIRNKLIIGKTRTNIFVSNSIVTITVFVGLYVATAMITAFISFMLFGVVHGYAWALETHAVYLILNFLIILLTWVCIATIINLFAFCLDKTAIGIVIVMTVGTGLGVILPVIIQAIIQNMSKSPEQLHNAYEVYYYFEGINYFHNIFSTDGLIGSSPDTVLYNIYEKGIVSMAGIPLTNSDGLGAFNMGSLIIRFASPVLFSSLNLYLGWLAVRHRDYK